MNESLAATMAVGAKKVVEVLARVADTKLHRTANLYKDLLSESVSVTPTKIVIALSGVAKDIELGYPARDLKAKLLASPNAKTSAKGVRYIDIPFRHGTRFNSMPSEIKAVVKVAVQSERASASVEGRLERNPLRVTGQMPALNPNHTTSIHSDMLRTARSGGKATYQTIRRISSNSKAQAWWHPGYTGLHALRTLTNFPKLVLQVIFKQEMAKRGLKTK